MVSFQQRLEIYLCIFITLGQFLTIQYLYADEGIQDQCIICHRDGEILPKDSQEYDVHLQPGLSCSGCHGGDLSSDDPDQAMNPKNGFIGVPAKKDIPKLCGKCHSNIEFMREYQPQIPTDQVEQFYTSVHGQKLRKGDQKVADCTSCHTVHSIISAKDTRSSVYAINVPATCKKCHSDKKYMEAYGIPTDQFEKYSKSVHGVDLLEKLDTGAPACNDCHGNHGAIPPGVSSISHVCGLCHVNNMEYFSSSKMGRIFEEEELHACEECHGNHEVKKASDEMISTGDQSVCLNCHDKGDAGYRSAEKIYAHLHQLVATLDSAETRSVKIRKIGMDDVEIQYILQEAHQNLIQSRTLVHTFDPEKVGEQSTKGIQKAQEALLLAAQEIDEYSIRRLGFGVATLFITILVVALFFKIRSMDKD